MKHAIALLCILTSFYAHAQFNKGDKFIGGNVTLRHFAFQEDGNGVSQVKLSPFAGIFLNKNFALGISPGFSSDLYKSGAAYGQGKDKQTVRTFTYSVFAKRFFTISDKFFFALTGGLSYARTNTAITNNGSKLSARSYTMVADVTPSFIFFPSNHWSIEANIGSLSYVRAQQLHATDTRSNEFQFNAGTFSLGFTYYLRK